eukprot:GHRR01006161.1.p1 GENE.GHRR01006161.1~~GHRR01006161.1.p1  ORF type:complete len:2934 (+),score=1214.27 GHRR01006161.1:179-8980(+)
MCMPSTYRACCAFASTYCYLLETILLSVSLPLCLIWIDIPLQVLVLAAKDIAIYPNDDPTPHSRAQALLQALNRWAEQHSQPTAEEAASWKALQGIAWCPVLVESPDDALPWPHAPVKWHTEVHAGAAATQQDVVPAAGAAVPPAVLRMAPKMCATMRLAWLTSAPLRLVDASKGSAADALGPAADAATGFSPVLEELLGWSQQQALRASVVVAQLMELGRKYPAGQVQDANLRAKLLEAAGSLYTALASAVHDPEQQQLLEMTLAVAPAVWVGHGFAFPAVSALQDGNMAAPATGTNMQGTQQLQGNLLQEPAEGAVTGWRLQQQGLELLWAVPFELLQQYPEAAQALRGIGVPERHDLGSYAVALSVLAEGAGEHALQEENLSMALQLADAAAHALLTGVGSARQLQSPAVLAAAAALQDQAAKAAGRAAAVGADLLLLPDSQGFMAPPGELYYNDAAWLEAEGLRLAHPGLNQATAEALGVRSMRYHHEVSQQLTNNIPCPSVDEAAAKAAAVLAASAIPSLSATYATDAAATPPCSSTAAVSSPSSPATATGTSPLMDQASRDVTGALLTTLLAVLAWADQLRGAGEGTTSISGGGGGVASGAHAVSMDVTLDERQHGIQSLLHPGLAKLQGPSVCIALHGLHLSQGQLSQLASPSKGAVAGVRRPAACTTTTGASVDARPCYSPAEVMQMGLCSVWAITDVLQVMSGDTTCYWDPCGTALAQTAAELRSPVPRGRSVKHIQPGLTDRFADQWSVWEPCTFADASAAMFSVQTVYLRLPLRLQDSNMHSSVLAAAAGTLLGTGGRSLGLSMEDVRRQVAAFGPAAARSLLFLGHIERISVAHWPSGPQASSPTRLWRAAVVPTAPGSPVLRTGMLPEQQMARYQQKERSFQGPGGLLARIGNRGGSSSRSTPTTYKNCWTETLQVVHRPALFAQLSAGQQPGNDSPAAGSSASGSTDGPSAGELRQQLFSPDSSRRSSSIDRQQGAHNADTDAQQQMHYGSTHQQSGASNELAPPSSSAELSTRSDSAAAAQVARISYTWMVSAVCKVQTASSAAAAAAAVQQPNAAGEPSLLGLGGLLHLAGTGSSSSGTYGGSSAGGAESAGQQLVWMLAAVAVCTAQNDTRHQRVISTSGLFSSVEVPSGGGSQLGRQKFLVNFSASPEVRLAVALAGRRLAATTPAASAVSVATVGTVPQSASSGQSGLSTDADTAAGDNASQAMVASGLVTAWQELLMMLVNIRVPGIYRLLPELVRSLRVGDELAAAVFKQIYQAVAGMPVWQLYNGRLVHLQEGAFLPPKASPQQQSTPPLSPTGSAAAAGRQQLLNTELQPAVPYLSAALQGSSSAPRQQSAAGSASCHAKPAATGLGPEAREFITQYLPLFKVPWAVVAQLEAAGVTGLRIVSPSVLRPLLRKLGERVVGPNDPHPFAVLSPVQALQLLEFCCSDLTEPDRQAGGTGGSGSSSSSDQAPGDSAAAAASGGGGAGGTAAVVDATELPNNLPEGAARLVGEVLGPAGLSTLRGLANQLQLTVTQGIDDVLNTVMEAMNEQPEQQRQQTGHRAGVAASVVAGPMEATGRGAGRSSRRSEGALSPPVGTASVSVTSHSSSGSVSSSMSPVQLNMSKVQWLRGLPIPIAAGSVAVLGGSVLLVCPEECQPSPQMLLPPHLQHLFVSAECGAALSWALKQSALRQELRLEYYGFQHLAAHLMDVLGSTWVINQGAAGQASSSTSTSTASTTSTAALAGLPVQVAVSGRAVAGDQCGQVLSAVPWNDGAAGGPNYEWLQQLWQLILGLLAAAPGWDENITLWSGRPGSSFTRSSSASKRSSSEQQANVGGIGPAATGSTSSRRQHGALAAIRGIRHAAERARGLGRGLAEVLGAELLTPQQQAAAGLSAGNHSTVAAIVDGADPAAAAEDSMAATAAGQAAYSSPVWQPLEDWPLLPLVDGRLLKLRHRDLVLAVLPDCQVANVAGESTIAAPGDATLAEQLDEPWSWLLPAAVAAGLPVLDPRFNAIFSTGAGVARNADSTSSIAIDSAINPAAAAEGSIRAQAGNFLAPAQPVPVEHLLGPQPVLGRPPFLGPLVVKMAKAQEQLDSLKDTGVWDSQLWFKLFVLLADNPPRDLQADNVGFLRSLPMYKRLEVQTTADSEQQPHHHHNHQQQQHFNSADAGLTSTGGSRQSAVSGNTSLIDDGGSNLQLVALGQEASWVLTSQALLCQCEGLLSLPSLPKQATQHILEHRTNWGELYHIVGLEPANLAQLLQAVLLPHLLDLSPLDRLAALNLVQRNWSSLSQQEEFKQMLADIPFVPAGAQPVAAGAAAIARAAARDPRTSDSSSSSDSSKSSSGSPKEQLYRARQLFDPTVPLFAAVNATMGAGLLHGSGASIGASATLRALFPEPPFNSAAWLQVLRALGLQCKVTTETFMQLAKVVADRAAALAASSPASAAYAAAAAPGPAALRQPANLSGAAREPTGYVDTSGANPVQLQELLSAADALLAYLRGHWTGLGPDKPFWQEVGRVQFVPATIGLTGGRYVRQVFTSCSQAAQHKDWHLVWSVQPLLSERHTLPAMLAQQLGVKSPPALSVILQHLHTVGMDGGEELLSAWPDNLEPVAQVTLRVLEHLDREGLSPTQAQEVASAAFIPVAHGSRLVAPQQLYVRLAGAALAPFAWEVPGLFVAQLGLLKLLGVKEEPRAEDLVQALQRFEVQLAGRRLNPNELAAILRLLAFLCSRSHAADASYLAAARRSAAALLVPSAGAVLMPASKVVHVGNLGVGAAAARLLGRADPQQLVLAHPQLPDQVCRWLGVPNLSDILAEQLDESSDLTPLPGTGTTSLQQLQRLFSNNHFAASIFSIAAAHAAAVPVLRQLNLGAVRQLCSNAAGGKLALVRVLRSKVVLKSNGRDVTRDNASRQVRLSGGNGWLLVLCMMSSCPLPSRC